jgi:transcriptional regulator with PAS, ATPase and Fis domain
MRRIENIAARIRDVDSSVLLTGESGVGKEVVARFIHRNSTRAERPFVAIDCAALPSAMVESELFGFEQGAMPGAERHHAGRFEQAQGGTIFLDEVAEISLETQAKLLRVLQEREVLPLGASGPVALDVRVIAATQVNLDAAVAAGRFRADLYWRLNVIHIPIPPLRKRPDDILFLARRFVAEQAAAMERPILGLSAAAEAWLARLDYPGNVRELRNMIERAVALSAGPRLQEYDLKGEAPPEAGVEAVAPKLNLKAQVEDAERIAILRALEEANGVLQDAAALLGVSRKTLWDKLRRYGLGNA